MISMADVLENLPFPKPALLAAHGLLSEGGVLFVSMSNRDAFAWHALDEQQRNPYSGDIEHLHNFGRERLYQLLDECGFAPFHYGISERHCACMEVLARKRS